MCRPGLIQVQVSLASPAVQGGGPQGSQPLSFILKTSYCLCPELLTENPSHKPNQSPLTPTTLPEIFTSSRSPKKWSQKGRGDIKFIPVFLQYPLHSSHFLVSQTLFTKAVPSLKGRPNTQRQSHHSDLSEPPAEFQGPGIISQGLPAAVLLHLQPSWDTASKTFCSVFIHQLSQKDLVQRSAQETFKTQIEIFIKTANTKQACE